MRCSYCYEIDKIEELVVNGEASYACENDCKHTSSWVLPGVKDLGCGKVYYNAMWNPFA